MKKIGQPQEEPEMSFLDHLEELRWHLIRAVLAVVIAATLAFFLKGFIFDVLLFGPSKGDFWSYSMLCELSQIVGIDGGFCFEELPSVLDHSFFTTDSLFIFKRITSECSAHFVSFR